MRQALTAHLEDLAKTGATTTYGALAKTLGLRVAELTSALEALMEADAARGAPLRAALVCGRLTPSLPAPGFFLKAEELGMDVSDPAGFVAEQRRRLSLG